MVYVHERPIIFEIVHFDNLDAVTTWTGCVALQKINCYWI